MTAPLDAQLNELEKLSGVWPLDGWEDDAVLALIRVARRAGKVVRLAEKAQRLENDLSRDMRDVECAWGKAVAAEGRLGVAVRDLRDVLERMP